MFRHINHMSVSDVLKVFEYLSMGLEAALQLKKSKTDPESEAVAVPAEKADANQDGLKQVVVSSSTSPAVSLPGQIVEN